eukprot:Skav214190  [mRNA]  locus=scaffold3641:87590:90642:+ [translate_table: standard]
MPGHQKQPNGVRRKDWEFQCPRLWESLKATDDPKKRYCETCRENVFFCDSAEEVQNHTLQRRCVAFIAASDATMEVEAEDTVTLRVALLSGDELPGVCVPATASVGDVKQAIAKIAGHPPEEQRQDRAGALALLLAGTELADVERISSDLHKAPHREVSSHGEVSHGSHGWM